MTFASTTQWYMVTNHLNLSFMLASGLILPRSGFGEKYYRDPLQVFPGYIPLFCDPVPGSAVEMATKEAAHLIPVAAPVNLDQFIGPIATVDLQGKLLQERQFPEQMTGEEAVLLIPAPLPVSLLSVLNFDTQAAIQTFKKEVKEYSNVSIDNLSLKPLKKIFKHAGKEQAGLLVTPWYHAGTLQRDVPLDRCFSAGGMMGMAFHLADKNKSAMSAFKHAFDQSPADTEDDDKPGFTDRPLSWLISGTKPAEDHTLTEKMFWGMAAAIADKSALPGANARDRAMDFLENQCVRWPAVASEERLKKPLERLTRDLDGLDRGNSDLTRSQLFDRHEKPFARAVILFFLHRDTLGMIESSHEKLNPEDLMTANLLVWAHRGWMGLPEKIKFGEVLGAAVTHRMAALSHTLAGTGLSLGPAPAPPIPFPVLFKGNKDNEEWNAEQKKAALALAKAMKWDCISTVIALGNGDYKLRSSPGGVAIILEGLEKGISHDIHKEKFLNTLNDTKIPEKIYLEVRTILDNPK